MGRDCVPPGGISRSGFVDAGSTEESLASRSSNLAAAGGLAPGRAPRPPLPFTPGTFPILLFARRVLDLAPVSWRILITARTFREVGEAATKFLKASGAEVLVPPKLGPLTVPELLPQLPGVDAVLASMDHFKAELLRAPEAASLKMISRWGVGYDAIDVPAATEQGIMVAYTPGLLNDAVADYAFSLLLGVARRLAEGHESMKQGLWKSAWGHDVHGKSLGLIGCGRIGQAMAKRARGFDMRILAYDIAPNAEAEKLGIRFVDLDTLLEQSDFVSLHASLTPDNRGLLNETRLRKMKSTAYLINTARGALVDEAALVKVLQEGVLAGAAVDAFAVEPLPADHPLRSTPRLLLTPHQASFTRETGEKVSMAAAEAIVNAMQGRRPRWVVDEAVYRSPKLRAKVQ
ncbi:MAG: hydroxyacid dehydrogenase [Verrucomicrobia bacterium]|nr:hydroxyacid dehydrogenase [Verrucomicrobiota bacterium]